MSAKIFSPGPWAVVKEDGNFFVVDCHGRKLAQMLTLGDVCEGNCALMADAFKLATATDDMLEYLGHLARQNFHPESSDQAYACLHALEEVGMR